MSHPQRKHFEVLDGLRGVAALAVVSGNWGCGNSSRLIRLHPLVIAGSVLGLVGFLFSHSEPLGALRVAEIFACSLLMIPFPVMHERPDLLGRSGARFLFFYGGAAYLPLRMDGQEPDGLFAPGRAAGARARVAIREMEPVYGVLDRIDIFSGADHYWRTSNAISPHTKSLCVFRENILPLYMTHYWVIWIFGDYLGSHRLAPVNLFLIVLGAIAFQVTLAYTVMVLYDIPLRRRLSKA